MNEATRHEPRDVTSLSRKSWTAYVWPVVLTLLALALTLPPAWQHAWTTALACGAVIRAISACVMSSEIILTKMWKGHEAVMTINSRHQELIRSGPLI